MVAQDAATPTAAIEADEAAVPEFVPPEPAELAIEPEAVAFAIATCLEDHEYQGAVLADLQEGMEIGVTGTAAFLINGHLVSGAQPFEVFEQVVETLIAETAAPVANN